MFTLEDVYLHTIITLFPCKQLQTETHMAVCIIIIIFTTFRGKQTGLIADI